MNFLTSPATEIVGCLHWVHGDLSKLLYNVQLLTFPWFSDTYKHLHDFKNQDSDWCLRMSYTAMPRRWWVMVTIMLTNVTAFLVNTHSEGESLLWREERKETRKNLTSSKRWHRGDHGTLVSKVRRPCYQAQRLGQNAAGSPGQRRLWHREEQSEEALLTRLLPWAKMPPARLGDLDFELFM